MSAPPSPPWQNPSFLPEKPAGTTYGYLAPASKDQPAEFHACSLVELADTVADQPQGLLVGAPGHDHLVPPSCCRDLWPAIEVRESRRRHRQRKDALLSCLIFGAITAYSAIAGKTLELVAVLLLVFFGVVPLVQNLIGTARHRLRGKRTPEFAETAARTLFSYWLGTRPITATRFSVYTLAALFALQVLPGIASLGDLLAAPFAEPVRSLKAAALDKAAARSGEWWRLLSATLLHGNLIHIAFNATAFYNIGSVIEPLYGRAAVLGTFLLSALAGSLASLAFLPDTLSVGASGGILGLVGFLLVVSLRHRKILPPDLAKSIVRAVLFLAAIGIAARHFIDNAAHAGGFLAGVLVALPTTRDPGALGDTRDSPPARFASIAAAAVLAATALFTAYKILAPTLP